MHIDVLKYAEQLTVYVSNGKPKYRDLHRNQLVAATPEEMVRQSLIQCLMHEFDIKAARINTEFEINFHGMKKRIDIVVFNKAQKPWIIIETKAPMVKINQKVIQQASIYNSILLAPLLMVSNGLETRLFQIDFEDKKTLELETLIL